MSFEWVYVLLPILAFIWIEVVWVEFKKRQAIEKRFLDLKNFRTRNPLRNVGRIRTIYDKLPELSGDRKKSFKKELVRRLDACEQQFNIRPKNRKEAYELFEKVRRKR